MSLEQIVILGLATWRLSYLIVKEDGPFAVFKRLRSRTTLGGLLTCAYCCSVWLALMFVLLADALRPLMIVLAVAGIAAIVQRWLGFDFDSQ